MSKLELLNHTQTPNVIIDEYMKELSGSEIKVLLSVCRKTIGWHKVSDSVSLSQLEEMTGLTRPTVSNAVKDLESRNVIVVDRSKNTNSYTLNYDSKKIKPVKKSNHPSKKIKPDSASNSKIIKLTKESIKETYTKDTSERKLKLINVSIADYVSIAELDQIEDRMLLLAIHVWSDIHNMYPDNKTVQKANLKTWRRHVRLAIEQDNRTIEGLWKIWKLAHRDSFWQENILSTEKLRDQYDQLQIKLGRRKNRSQGGEDNRFTDLFSD